MVYATVLPLIGHIALDGGFLIVFFLCYLAVMGFEFVNGFHDTANAVATVIYTKTLKPYYAIVWSGIWNFLGVLIVGTAVAMTLLKLVPLDTLITLPLQVGACLVIAILLASIVWNLGTWYLGIPLSSTHTLIGAMIGASLSFTYFYGGPGVNWSKAGEIGLSLLISPIIGFGGAALLMLLERKTIKSKRLFHVPEGEDDKPPMPIRILLVCTCTLVSFFHGSNDGQKGVGLLLLILIVFLPASFAFNPKISDDQTGKWLVQTEQTLQQYHPSDTAQTNKITKLIAMIDGAKKLEGNKEADNTRDKFKFRKSVQKVAGEIKKLTAVKGMEDQPGVKMQLTAEMKSLQKVTDFAPIWVIITISLSLGRARWSAGNASW
jgi:PiT family inorganic phosphate transporter